MFGIWPLFIIVLTYACEQDNQWKSSEPNWIQIFSCESGFQYRVCNSENKWSDIISNNCECTQTELCQNELYHGILTQTTIDYPSVVSTSPMDMDMNVSPIFSVTIQFSTAMHHRMGRAFIQSQDSVQIDDSFMKTECNQNSCTVSILSALQPDSFFEMEISSDFFVNEYNIPLQYPIRMLFRTSHNICNTHSIQEGFGNSQICSCFSNDDSCTCSCGDVQVNRGF